MRAANSVMPGKAKKRKKAVFLSFFSLMKRSKNHPTTEFAKNLVFKLKSFKWEAERFSRLNTRFS
jgi:hypothetical protein